MQKFKAVGVKNLKNNLSAYLRDVRNGSCILVTDHEEVVAEIHQPSSIRAGAQFHPLLEEWIREGKVQLPAHPHYKQKLPVTKLRLPKGTAQKLIDEDRGD